MRYCAEHKAQTREKLIQSSAALAKQGGFASTGVDALMKAIGLTGGAFYAHFASKDALFDEVICRELEQSFRRMQCQSAEQLSQRLAKYLSAEHVANIEGGCPLPALGDEIVRAGDATRGAVEQGLTTWQQNWAQVLGEDKAWAALSQCVGSLLLARMLTDPNKRQALLDASLASLAEGLAGN